MCLGQLSTEAPCTDGADPSRQTLRTQPGAWSWRNGCIRGLPGRARALLLSSTASGLAAKLADAIGDVEVRIGEQPASVHAKVAQVAEALRGSSEEVEATTLRSPLVVEAVAFGKLF